jgi:putative intracellular protease/amidase
MNRRAIHVVVFDGFADWEPAYALAELRRWGKRDVVTTGFTSEAVTSMGGLRVLPDRTLSEVRAHDVSSSSFLAVTCGRAPTRGPSSKLCSAR